MLRDLLKREGFEVGRRHVATLTQRMSIEASTLQAVKTTDSHTFKASVEGVLAGFSTPFSNTPAPTTSASAAAGTQAVHEQTLASLTQLAVGGVGAGAADFLKCGETRAVNRLLVDGKQLPTSFATTTYNDVASFVGALATGFQGFAEDKSKKYFSAQHAADPGASVAHEARTLGEFAGKVLAERDRTASPQLYWEWGEHVDAVNLFEAEADLSLRLGDTARAAAAAQQIRHIHDDPAYREGRFLINVNARSTSDVKGVNGVLGLTHSVENRVTEQSIRFT